MSATSLKSRRRQSSDSPSLLLLLPLCLDDCGRLPSDVSGGRTVKVPFGPNEIVCAVLSCVNDPRMVPSTDVVLTRKMLDEGLRMGAASDPRVTPDSILLVIDDLNDKLVAYIDFVKQRARLL